MENKEKKFSAPAAEGGMLVISVDRAEIPGTIEGQAYWDLDSSLKQNSAAYKLAQTAIDNPEVEEVLMTAAARLFLERPEAQKETLGRLEKMILSRKEYYEKNPDALERKWEEVD